MIDPTEDMTMLTNPPKISIVTPSYNQASFLEQTITSIINQEYPRLEYILMDGGSTDGSLDTIEKYARHFHHWESGRDDGQADAIYRGFEISTGEVLGWVNSDDFLLPDALKAVGEYFAKHSDTVCVVGGTIVVDNQNRIVPWACNLGTRVTLRGLLYDRGGFHQPATFWRRDAFFECGGFNRKSSFCFDYDMYLRLMQVGNFEHIRKFLAGYRVHHHSKTSTLQHIRLQEREPLKRRYGYYKLNRAARFWLRAYYAIVRRSTAYIFRLSMKYGLLNPPCW